MSGWKGRGRYLALWTVLLVCLTPNSVCSAPQGSLTLTVRWGARTAQAIPQDTGLIVIRILEKGGKQLAMKQVPIQSASGSETVKFEGLRPGPIVVKTSAHVLPDGSDPAIALGERDSRVIAGQQSTVRVPLESTVNSVVIEPNPLMIVFSEQETASLKATAKNRGGDALLVKTFLWSSGSTSVAQVVRKTDVRTGRPTGEADVSRIAPGQATITAQEPASGHTGSARVDVVPPQLRVTKEADRATVPPGQIITYTLTVQNSGPGRATGVQLRDVLPAGTTRFQDPDRPEGGTLQGGAVVWDLGVLAEQASVSQTLRVQVSGNTREGTRITNVAQASSAEVPAPVSSAIVTTAVASSLLRVALTVDRTSVQFGEMFAYRITVGNFGTARATNVLIEDVLPPFVKFEGVSGNGIFDADTRTARWNIPSLDPDASETVIFRVRNNTDQVGAIISNVAQARSAEIPDPILSNPVATTVIPVQLQLLKFTDLAPDTLSVQEGQTITYFIQVNNFGDAATNVRLFDSVPVGTRFVSASDDVVPDANGTLVWNLGSVPHGDSDLPERQVSFAVQVTASSGTISNVAQVISDQAPFPVVSNRVDFVVQPLIID